MKQLVRDIADRTGLIAYYYRYREWKTGQQHEPPPESDENGVAIPSRQLMMLVAGTGDWRWFLKSGREDAEAFARIATDAGFDFSSASRILDLGCGCGRIIRHMPSLTKAELWGADYNASLTNWCAANLPGQYIRNALNPPLKVPDGQFDLTYLMSVFTHLQIKTQRLWLAELARLLRPGGLALVTFHDQDQVTLPTTPEAQAALKEDGFYTLNTSIEGSNFVATFQLRESAEALFSEYFEVVGILPSQASGVRQAVAILKNRDSTAT